MEKISGFAPADPDPDYEHDPEQDRQEGPCLDPFHAWYDTENRRKRNEAERHEQQARKVRMLIMAIAAAHAI
jgi:hypothetical protein